MSELTRYDPDATSGCGMREINGGDYVGYSEYAAQIAHLTAELAQANKWGGELQRKIAEKDSELEQHCKRVILCCRHCGMAFGQEAREKAEDALRKVLEHERQCQPF